MFKEERKPEEIQQIENTAKKYEELLTTNKTTIILCDREGKTIAILGHKRNRTRSIYKLVLGNYAEELEDNTYDTYFFGNIDELTEILDFMTAHKEIYSDDTQNTYDATELLTTGTQTDYIPLNDDEYLEDLAYNLDFWTF